MTTKQFSIKSTHGKLITTVFQSEEHLSLNLDTERSSSGYTLDLDKSALISEVSNAVENYIEAFCKSANHVTSFNPTLNIYLTINQ